MFYYVYLEGKQELQKWKGKIRIENDEHKESVKEKKQEMDATRKPK